MSQDAKPSFFKRWSRAVASISTKRTRVYVNDKEVHGEEAADAIRRADKISREIDAAMKRLFKP